MNMQQIALATATLWQLLHMAISLSGWYPQFTLWPAWKIRKHS